MPFKVKDHYYKKAKKENYLARSAYKLEEIDSKFKVFQKGDRVLDLGYYPGSWIQYCLGRVGEKGQVVGVDIQPINNKLLGHSNLTLFCLDAFNVEKLSDLGVESKFDIVVSDMAPKTTGIKNVDQVNSLNLVENVFATLDRFLKLGGHMVIKVFESQDAQDYFKTQKGRFEKTYFFRPKATRSTSQEYFFCGKSYKG